MRTVMQFTIMRKAKLVDNTKLHFEKLKPMRHPFLVNVVGVNKIRKTIRFEHYTGEGLRDHIKDHRYTVDDLIRFGAQITSAINYLHSRNIVHCNVILDNVAVVDDKHVKLGGLQNTRSLRPFYDDENSSACAVYGGKIEEQLHRWHAKEVNQEGLFSKESDIWSLGILLWELFHCLEPAGYDLKPFPKYEDHEILNKLQLGSRPIQPRRCPDWLFIVMTQCWLLYTSERASSMLVLECLTHRTPWESCLLQNWLEKHEVEENWPDLSIVQRNTEDFIAPSREDVMESISEEFAAEHNYDYAPVHRNVKTGFQNIANRLLSAFGKPSSSSLRPRPLPRPSSSVPLLRGSSRRSPPVPMNRSSLRSISYELMAHRPLSSANTTVSVLDEKENDLASGTNRSKSNTENAEEDETESVYQSMEDYYSSNRSSGDWEIVVIRNDPDIESNQVSDLSECRPHKDKNEIYALHNREAYVGDTGVDQEGPRDDYHYYDEPESVEDYQHQDPNGIIYRAHTSAENMNNNKEPALRSEDFTVLYQTCKDSVGKFGNQQGGSNEVYQIDSDGEDLYDDCGPVGNLEKGQNDGSEEDNLDKEVEDKVPYENCKHFMGEFENDQEGSNKVCQIDSDGEDLYDDCGIVGNLEKGQNDGSEEDNLDKEVEDKVPYENCKDFMGEFENDQEGSNKVCQIDSDGEDLYDDCGPVGNLEKGQNDGSEEDDLDKEVEDKPYEKISTVKLDDITAVLSFYGRGRLGPVP
ncbi:hypothetical protein QZH41_003422 [Actinostola sp. cb2023]|nr:hypothetical protein QZH41_003422 [Actinostola sp. cb2023]